jgi:hypothetical protein
MSDATWPEGPMTFAIRPGCPLLILACSATKKTALQHEFVRFVDLYDGPVWQQVRAAKFPVSNIAALSALYGYLEPGCPITTYDRQLDEDGARRFIRTSNHLYLLRRDIERAGSAFFVGGVLYRSIVEAAISADAALAARVTYATGSYLKQRGALRRWLKQQSVAS